jgi:hypothetical protein
MPKTKRSTDVETHLVKRQASWTEEFAVGGRQLIGLVENLVAQGNVRRLLVLKPDGAILLETSLTKGVAAAGVFTILAPMLTALGALAALLAEVRVRVVFTGDPPHG